MKTQFLQIPDGTIAYDDSGSGPLVVCSPGIGDLRGQFRFLVPQLTAAGLRVVTMDNRGHGESSADWPGYSAADMGSDMLALIRHLDAGPAVLVGHSKAAGAAVWAAAESAELVRGLVLPGPAVHGEIGASMCLLIRALFARPWGAAAWVKFYSTLYPTRKPQDWQAYTSAIQRNLAEPGRLEALRKMTLSPTPTAEARLEEVRVPALIVMGSKDPDFKPDPQAEARWVAEQLRGSYVMIEGAGHYPHVEMPEISGPLIVDFLKTLEAEPAHAVRTY
jgi:pimeloyl-ACP methyl ester carboxylesterase